MTKSRRGRTDFGKGHLPIRLLSVIRDGVGAFRGLAKIQTVQDIMTKRAISVDYDTPVLEALRRMLQIIS